MIEAGERFQVQVEFYGSDYLPTDPIRPVDLYFEGPSGESVGPYSMSEQRAGVFVRRLSLSEAGTYRPWVEFGGSHDSVEVGQSFQVTKPPR